MEQASSLEGFFQEEVDRALKAKRIATDTLTEHYLVHLLATYAHQSIDEAPLAIKMMLALEASPRERRDRLREVGDTSLFVSGFWADSFARRAVDMDYYIGMGGSAYGELARTGEGWSRDPFGDVYGDLSERFDRFVEVLALVSQRMMPVASYGAQDIVKLYEKWSRTRNSWAARRLAALGVVPTRANERPQ